MTKKIILLIIVFCAICLLEVTAQINIGGEPISYRQSYSVDAPVAVMPKIDLAEAEKQDLQDNANGLPPRFGILQESNLNINNSGVWEVLPNNEGRVWRLSIKCPKAKSINLLYDAFWLPEGATLYIYNKDKTENIGGFTARNNNSPKGQSIGYATGILKGEEITLEYFEPNYVTELPELSISNVVHGYNTMTDVGNGNFKLFGDSGSCQMNINCPDGSSWQTAKSSVELTLVGGNRWCTGSLLNATGDFLPYFLTANHCLSGWAIPTALDAVSNPVASNWMFYWEYESAGCANPSSEPGWTSTTGAYLVANKADSDFALMYLTEDPFRDAGIIPSYNGWSTNTPGAGGAGIHHPSGDTKKISLFTQTPQNNALPGCINTNTWSVVFQHPSGAFTTTEGGSSGSPLYDNNGRVVGQLWGGRDLGTSVCQDGPTCGNPANDISFYGKFGVSWDDSGGAKRRLKDWLSPTCNINYTVPSNLTTGVSHIFADVQINSNKSISGTNSYVSYNAGETVRLTEGFSVSGGATFHASNEDCNTATREAGVMDAAVPNRVGEVKSKMTGNDEGVKSKMTDASQE